jgi:CubicO group peptidase (beta-lactamase class C family)
MPRTHLAPWLLVFGFVIRGGAVATAQAPTPVAPEKVGLSAAGLKRIDALLLSAVEQKHLAGGVALVARHGKIAYLHGVGWSDIEARRAMAPDALFRVASMTKPVTSVAVMMLVDEGKIKLTDPVSKYVPEFKGPHVLVAAGDRYETRPAKQAITIRDLLTHTSGLTYGFFDKKFLGDLYREAGVSDGIVQTEGTLADNIRRLARVPLMFDPGTAWEYGLSTEVLGRVVEVASGKNLDQLFRERIFRPLGMHDTYFFLPDAKRPRLAALYRPGKEQQIERVGDERQKVGALVYSASYPYRGPRTYFSPGAGLVSTAPDYARFLQMLLSGGRANGVRLLKPETVKQMTENQIGDLKPWIAAHGDKFGYGFGVVSPAAKDVASVGSYGWGGIFYTYFLVDPRQDLIAIFMTQIYPTNHLKLHEEFERRVYKALAD